MAGKDYYKILEVEKGASDDDIKKSYRKLVTRHHPDRNKDNPKAAEEKFKEINEAYDVLKDPQKRAAYDRFGSEGLAGGMGGPGGGFGASFGGGFSDIFEDMFSDLMGRNRGGAGGTLRGADVQYAMDITLEDAFKGKEVPLRVPVNDTCEACGGSGAEAGTKPETCPTCNGHGRVRLQQGFFTIERTCSTCGGVGTTLRNPCKKCVGSGRVRRDKTLTIKIPAGVETGRRIRLSGEGEAGVRGGPSGDLYVLLTVRPHKLFRRENADLHCRVPITMTRAALGGEIEVPTLESGTTALSVPAGTQSGQRFRIKGKGMSILNSAARGDLYIEAFVETPVNLSRKQQDLLRQFDETLGGASASKHSPESSGFFKKVKEFWDDLRE
ncbi:MAG TPA: molecular chaperone DnaJ [Alphaproteobacteria bacterium]|nr:molecular chaperone DnaJ [Alphaproteobacteria bacterium]